MKRCAFLTLADPAGYVIDDELAIPALAARGWRVETVPWTESADWAAFDIVVIRSTWDYQHHLDRFLDVLGHIESSGTRLENPAALVRWNTRKAYLRELEARGMSVVPTLWGDDLDEGAFPAYFDALGADELVVKPQVGANAGDTLRVRRDDVAAQREAAALFTRRPYMVQPFLCSVTDEGEYS
ncbi:MAG TPA: hypothetical protein VK928_04950, partial [Longimicrobiales bacterium]|nr:hypothetical protein [Longimicrobiales bacterium]